MFVASATSFLISAVIWAAKLASTGILIHAVLIGYPGLSMVEKMPLVNDQLIKPNLVLELTYIFEVWVLVNGV